MKPHTFFLAASSGFLVGIGIGIFDVPGLVALAFGLMGGLLVFGIVLCPVRLLLMVVGSLSLVGGFFHARETLRFWQDSPPLTVLNAVVVVKGFPEEKATYREVRLELLGCGEEMCLPEARVKQILWRAPLSETPLAGERFLFSCALEPIENFSEDFDYRMFLAKEGVGYLCRQGERGDSLALGPKERVWQGLAALRQKVEESLTAVFPEPEAGLAKGLILGGGGFLGENLEEDFRRIGMTHIVAVSGYNILLVAGFFLYSGNAVGLWRRQTLLLALLGVALFVLLVGAPASALRAGLMAAVIFLALATGRLGSWYTGLLAALTLMLSLNPLLLRYDVGFQLSFLAVLGVIVAGWGAVPRLAPRTPWEIFYEALSITVSVELFILPAILYHFGTFSWFSLVANLILLPLVPLAMLASFLGALFGFLLPAALALLLAWPGYLILQLITWFAEYFGALSFVAIEGLHIGWLPLVLWYALLICGHSFRYFRHKRSWYATAFLPLSESRAPLPGSGWWRFLVGRREERGSL